MTTRSGSTSSTQFTTGSTTDDTSSTTKPLFATNVQLCNDACPAVQPSQLSHHAHPVCVPGSIPTMRTATSSSTQTNTCNPKTNHKQESKKQITTQFQQIQHNHNIYQGKQPTLTQQTRSFTPRSSVRTLASAREAPNPLPLDKPSPAHTRVREGEFCWLGQLEGRRRERSRGYASEDSTQIIPSQPPNTSHATPLHYNSMARTPGSGRTRQVKMKIPQEVDAWGRKTPLYKAPTAEDLMPPPDYDPASNKYSLRPCLNCGQPMYVLKGVGNRQKYHRPCKPKKNTKWGNDPDDKTFMRASFQPGGPRRKGPVCGAEIRHRGPGGEIAHCQQPAGWKTDHPGYGTCHYHLGNAPANSMKAAKDQTLDLATKAQRKIYGDDVDIDPITAILDEVRRTVGHVEWLRDQVTALDAEIGSADPLAAGNGIMQMTPMGLSPSGLINLYQQERNNLIRVCKAAVAMGVAERTVKLAEDQGRLIAAVLRATFEDARLGLTPEQKIAYPQIVREHLLAVPSAAAASRALDVVGRPA